MRYHYFSTNIGRFYLSSNSSTPQLLNSLQVFPPAFDLQLLGAEQAERVDEGAGKAGVGDERDVVVDGIASDGVVVEQLGLGVVLGDVDHQVDHAAFQIV